MYIQHEKGLALERFLWREESRDSTCDDNLVMIQIEWWWSRSSDDDLDPVMIQIQWLSRSSDDPDLVMMSSDDPDQVMIQIQWCWSRSRDDLDPVVMSHDDPDWEMIQIRRIKMTWRWRWLEDSEELRCRWRDDPVDTEKKTSAENCVERIPS